MMPSTIAAMVPGFMTRLLAGIVVDAGSFEVGFVQYGVLDEVMRLMRMCTIHMREALLVGTLSEVEHFPCSRMTQGSYKESHTKGQVTQGRYIGMLHLCTS